MVHDDVTARWATGPAVATIPARAGEGPAPCAAHPGTRLLHPEGRCECFFGGPAPEFGPDPVPVVRGSLP